MNLFVAIYSAVLFFILSPSVFLRIPSGGSKMTVTFVHSVIFGIILYLTAGYIWRFSKSSVKEGKCMQGRDYETCGKGSQKQKCNDNPQRKSGPGTYVCKDDNVGWVKT